MTHEQNRSPFPRHAVHHPQTFFLKRHIAHGKHFINQKNLRGEMSRHGERQPHIHSTRIVLHGNIDEPLDLGKFNNLVKQQLDLRPLHPEECSTQINIVSACQFRMKTRAHFKQ